MVVIAGRPFGDRGDGEAHRLQEQRVPLLFAFDHSPREEKRAQRQARPQDSLSEVLQLFFERRFALRWRAHQRAQLAELRSGARRHHHRAAFPADDRRPEKEHVLLIAQRRIGREAPRAHLFRTRSTHRSTRILGPPSCRRPTRARRRESRRPPRAPRCRRERPHARRSPSTCRHDARARSAFASSSARRAQLRRAALGSNRAPRSTRR